MKFEDNVEINGELSVSGETLNPSTISNINTNVNTILEEVNDSSHGLSAIRNAISGGGSGGASYLLSNTKRNTDAKKFECGSLPGLNILRGRSVVLGDSIYMQGGSAYNSQGSSAGYTNFNSMLYKYDGNTWQFICYAVSSNFYYPPVLVVYNGKIHSIGGYESVTSSVFKQDHKYLNGTSWIKASDIPFTNSDYYINGVVYNNKIYVKHNSNLYSWDGSTWNTEPDIPYNLGRVSMSVYNNEIHMINSTYHLKFDGTDWTDEVSTLPISNTIESVIYNNKLFIIGSGGLTYSWDGSTWTNHSNVINASYDYAGCVVYRNKIHILGGNDLNYHSYEYPRNDKKVITNHRIFNGESWTYASSYMKFNSITAITFNDKLYILNGLAKYGIRYSSGTYYYASDYSATSYIIDDPEFIYSSNSMGFSVNDDKTSSTFNLYKPQIGILGNNLYAIGGYYNYDSTSSNYNQGKVFNGSSWSNASGLSYSYYITGMYCRKAVAYNNLLYFFSCGSSSNATYTYNGSSFTSVTSPGTVYNAIVYNNELYAFAGTNMYKLNGSSFNNIGTIPISVSTGTASAVLNDELHLFYQSSHYVYNGTEWKAGSEMPFSLNGGDAAVFKDSIYVFTVDNNGYNCHAVLSSVASYYNLYVEQGKHIKGSYFNDIKGDISKVSSTDYVVNTSGFVEIYAPNYVTVGIF